MIRSDLSDGWHGGVPSVVTERSREKSTRHFIRVPDAITKVCTLPLLAGENISRGTVPSNACFDRLIDSSPGIDPEGVEDVLDYGVGEGLPSRSWWWLAIAAPYSSIPLELLHTIGTSAAVLGLVLLLGQTFDPIIGVLAPAGSMTLTLYSAHLLFMASGILADGPFASLAVQAGTAVVFAVIWQSSRGKGPLEAALGAVFERVRTRVGTAGASRS